MTNIETVRNAAALRQRIAAWRSAGERVGLVPTMGGIHDGHLALVRAAREGCDRVAATLFVNPKQFGPSEDFAAYPRDEVGDTRLLGEMGAELLFAPGMEEMYPEGFATRVSVSGVTEGLCGAHRPGFFDGVATAVCKLLMQALPDAAYFGEKDYQQLRMIRRMVADLAIPVDIVPVATVREADGLALSSRNDYLTDSERQNAPTLYRVLSAIASALEGGKGSVADLTVWGLGELEGAGFGPIDYLEVRDADTLRPVEVLEEPACAAGAALASAKPPAEPGSAWRRPARVLAAAWLGKARLIDNVAVRPAR